MAENNNQGGQKNKKLFYKLMGGALLLVVVLLIIFGGNKNNSNEENSLNGEEQSENNGSTLSVVKPVVSGDYEYAWQGVKWIFDTESVEVAGTNQTWLKMEFADFTRNGNAISFGRPYKLGVHPGTCEEVDYIDTSLETGIPFAYARCTGEGIVRDFVVLQEAESVVIKMNEKKGEESTGWKEWYKINVTEIVR